MKMKNAHFLFTVIAFSQIIIAISLQSLSEAAYATNADIEYDVLEFDWHEDKLPFVLTINATAKEDNDGDDTDKVATLHLGLYENKTGKVIPNVTYYIKITELQDSSSDEDNTLVNSRPFFIQAFFFAKDGELRLTLSHRAEEEAPTIITGGERENYLNAWVPSSDSNSTTTTTKEPLAVRSPQIRQDGIYHIQVGVFTFYDIRNIPTPDEMPVKDYV